MSTYTIPPTSSTHTFIDRPPTPRPCFVVQVPPKPSSYHSLSPRSPVRRPYSSFSPASNPTSPCWDISVISPSVASFYSDRDEDANEDFRSPRLALQTTNLLGLDWQERRVETPIETLCTPISPSASDEYTGFGIAPTGELCSPPFELLTSDFLYSDLRDDVDALYTPISPSGSDDQEGDGWIPSLETGNAQPPRLALLTECHFQPDTWAFHTPLTPPEAAQQFEEDLSHDSARKYIHSYNHERHASELYTPISPSPHEYTNKFVLQPNESLDYHKFEASDLYTPISPTTSVQQGWKDLLFEIMTPAERFFVPDFEIERVSAPAPTELDTREISPDLEDCSAPPSISTEVDIVVVEAEDYEESRPSQRKPRSASVSSMPEEVVSFRENTQKRNRHSIAILDAPTRQKINECALLHDSVFQDPDSQPSHQRPHSPEPLPLALDFETVSRPRRHSFAVLDNKLREMIHRAVVLTSAVYIIRSCE